ncbi:general secretion pathway protein GspK [Novilysobacter spongiicola]|nr:type II secretion system protein GspK [Lysobacter spongiicola]
MRRAPAGGFVLVMVLAMLVILSILAGTVAATSARLREEQLERQRDLQVQLDMASTQATVMYLLNTQRMTFGGLTVDDRIALSEDERMAQSRGEDVLSNMPVGNEIALDGRGYRGLGDVVFAMRDDRGRLAVNWAPRDVLERFLELHGFARLPAPTLLNRLLDYQDPDDLYRLNSLEREGYLSRGLPPPTNRTLATPLELRRVVGWDEALGQVEDGLLLNALTTRRSAQVNVNTAPEAVLAALPGMDANAARRVVEARQVQPFTYLPTFFQFVGGVPGSEDALALYPSDSGTLELWAPESGTMRVLHWTLTPRDEGGKPWREDYEFTVAKNEAGAGTVPLAPGAAVLADAIPAQE